MIETEKTQKHCEIVTYNFPIITDKNWKFRLTSKS